MPPLAPAIMNIAGTEWIIIVLLAVVLLFGTKKLPQVSRSIGKAVGEYEKAKELFRKEMEEASEQVKSVTNLPRITGPVATEREKLETMAKSLGISHAGLTDDELRSLISKKTAR